MTKVKKQTVNDKILQKVEELSKLLNEYNLNAAITFETEDSVYTEVIGKPIIVLALVNELLNDVQNMRKEEIEELEYE